MNSFLSLSHIKEKRTLSWIIKLFIFAMAIMAFSNGDFKLLPIFLYEVIDIFADNKSGLWLCVGLAIAFGTILL